MLTIRQAKQDDAETIIELIKGLAEYEKEPDAVRASAEDIIRYGFGDRPVFQCLMCLWDDAPVGFALYFHTYSTWEGKPGIFLEDLFIHPEYRRHGIGKALMIRLAEIAVEEGCARFEWNVLDWNTPAIEFYKSLGGYHLSEWLPYRMDPADVKNLSKQGDSEKK
jgi:GNAT superfamily N-acetyltransferase